MSTLLEVSGVTVSFDGFRAINNLSFRIADAEMRAVIGPNGAGKTTFMDIVTGKTKPDEGRVAGCRCCPIVRPRMIWPRSPHWRMTSALATRSCASRAS